MAKLKKAFKSYQKKIQTITDKELMKSVQTIGMVAKSNCRIQSIADTITYGKIDNRYEVSTSGVESVYLEFGTGNFARVLLGNYPADWKEMAMRFYINGQGRTPAQPYLYPAFQREKQETVLDIGIKIEAL